MHAAPEGKPDYNIGLHGWLAIRAFDCSWHVQQNLQKLTDKRVRHLLFSII